MLQTTLQVTGTVMAVNSATSNKNETLLGSGFLFYVIILYLL